MKGKMNGVLIDLAKSLELKVMVSNDNLFSAQADDGRAIRVYHLKPGEWRVELFRGKPVRKLKHTYVGVYTRQAIQAIGVKVATYLTPK